MAMRHEITADNRNIVITAIDPGTATITVTATNPGGSAKQDFKVTVPQPTPPPTTTTPPPPTPEPTTTTTKHSNCPSPLEITRGGNRKCTLTKGHSLVYSVPDGEEERVRVAPPPDSSGTENVWTITAIRKGRPVVQIREDKTGDTVDEIMVIVPNTEPRLEDGELGPFPLNVATAAGLHTATLTSISAAFKDDDEVDNNSGNDGGIFNYKVQHKPDELLIETVKGFVLDEPETGDIDIRAVVLKPFKENFSIEIYAYDKDNDRSDNPVTVEFSAGAIDKDQVKPVIGTYFVNQKDNGDFRGGANR